MSATITAFEERPVSADSLRANQDVRVYGEGTQVDGFFLRRTIREGEPALVVLVGGSALRIRESQIVRITTPTFPTGRLSGRQKLAFAGGNRGFAGRLRYNS